MQPLMCALGFDKPSGPFCIHLRFPLAWVSVQHRLSAAVCEVVLEGGACLRYGNLSSLGSDEILQYHYHDLRQAGGRISFFQQ